MGSECFQPSNFSSEILRKTSGTDCPGTENAPDLPQQSTLCSPTWLKHLFYKSIYSFIQNSVSPSLCILPIHFDVAIVYSWIVEHIYQRPAEANKQPIQGAQQWQRWRKKGVGGKTEGDWVNSLDDSWISGSDPLIWEKTQHKSLL